MLGMLTGHAGDVENDADDVDGLAQKTYISRDNAVNYSILVGRTESKQLPKENKQNLKLNLDPI